MASSPIISWQTEGIKVETVTDFIFLGSKITADGDCSHKIKRCLLLGRKTMTNLHNILKSRHHFVNKGPYSQSYVFSSSHVWMWELEHKEGWAPKNWCFQIVLEKSLESPLDCKEIQPVHPKGIQTWRFIGRTDAEAETPILRPSDVKNQLIGKDPDAGSFLAIWSLVPLPFLKPAWTLGSSRFTYCWSQDWRILSITLLACEMSAIVQ